MLIVFCLLNIDYNEEKRQNHCRELTLAMLNRCLLNRCLRSTGISRCTGKVIATFGVLSCIDVLILNAGVRAFANKVNNISFEEWNNKTIAINLSGLFNVEGVL